jgi:hypothetical protein
MISPLIRLIAFVACIAALMGVGAKLGYNAGRAPLLVAMAKQDKQHADEKRLDAEQVKAALKAAITRGDDLSRQLLQSDQQIIKLSKEKRDAIQKVTTGSLCFGEPALRLLNGAPGLHVSGLPGATGSIAAESGATSTDTDIAQWVIDAGAQYEVCRTRLDALIDWHAAPQPSHP